MSNKNDAAIRDKIDRLDPLSCGIVYGKEEAWEKLQHKLDRKPAKKVMLRTWAVAACILLCISISVYYIKITKTSPYPSKGGENAIHNIALPTLATVSKPNKNEIMPKVSSVYTNKKQKKNDADNIAHLDTVQKTIIKEPEPITVATINHYDRKNMKVVHINDPDKDIRPQAAPEPTAQNKLPCIVRKLPVVHINDLYSKPYEALKSNTEKQGYNSIVHLSIANPFVSYTNNDEHFDHNLLKIHLNSQN